MSNFSLLALIFLSFAIELAVCQNKVVCYHTNWSQYRPDRGKFYPEDIDPFLCTHVIYSFAKLSGSNLAPYEWNDESTDWSKGMYERTIDLKKINPNLKILLAVGGWNHGSASFSDLVNNESSRKAFITNSLAYLKKHKFDGLDLDWEYPGSREGSRPTDKALFTTLIRELKAAYAADGLLVTAAVAAGKSNIDAGYEVDKICQDLDFVNLMAYDLHGGWETFTGHNAPLYARSDETGDQSLLNVDWTLNYWINKGCARNKLILGLPTYGRSFKLANANQNGLGASTAQFSAPAAGTWTREAGFLSYYEICERLKQGYTREWNNEQAVPFAYYGTEWFGYDDEDSLEIKVNYAKAMNLGGIMFWALDLDDFGGSFCGKGKYPLMNKAKNVFLGGGSVSTFSVTTNSLPTSSPAPTGTTGVTGVTGTTGSSGGGTTGSNKCYKGDGYYADKDTGCQQYYICNFTGTIYATISYHACASGLLFDEKLTACNYASAVTC